VKKKAKKAFYLILGLMLTCGVVTGIVTVVANDDDALEEDEERTVAKEDTYVEIDYPTSNYGGKDWFIVGEWFEANEAYLYFEFEDEPDEWTEVEISIYIYYVSETMEVEIYLTKAGWDEDKLTWQNRPAKLEVIDEFTISEEDTYTFKVTDEVEDLLDDDDEGISICIHHSDNATSNGHFQAASSEGYSEDDEAPLLIWTYTVVTEEEFYTVVLITIIAVVGIIGTILFLLYIVPKMKKKKGGVPEIKEPEVQKGATEKPEEKIPGPEGAKFYCPYCGTRTPRGDEFCSVCGKQLVDE